VSPASLWLCFVMKTWTFSDGNYETKKSILAADHHVKIANAEMSLKELQLFAAWTKINGTSVSVGERCDCWVSLRWNDRRPLLKNRGSYTPWKCCFDISQKEPLVKNRQLISCFLPLFYIYSISSAFVTKSSLISRSTTWLIRNLEKVLNYCSDSGHHAAEK